MQTDESKRRRVSQESNELEYTSKFLRYLAAYASLCAYCIVNGADNAQHAFGGCPTFRANSPGGFGAFYSFSRSIQYYHKQRVCYRCHLPNGYEDRIHPPFGNQNCRYEDLLAPLAFVIYQSPHMRQRLENHFGLTLPILKDLVSWLNAPAIAGHKNNLSALFLWYVEIA